MKLNSFHIQSKPNWFFLLVIALAFPIVYFHLFSAGFIAWDDPEYLINNKDVHQFSIKRFCTTFYIGNYHPLTMLSYALDWKFFGKVAFGYHCENLLWHFLNTTLVLYLGKNLGLKSLQSFFLAFVFAFHPLQIESVAWVAERKNLLYAFFFLASILSYFEYHSKQNIKYLFLVYLFFIFSLLAKPSAVVLPLVLIVIDYFIFKQNIKVLYKRYLLFFVLSLIFGIVTLFSQEEAKFLLNTHNYPLLNKIGIFGYGIFHYICKFLIPINLSAFYSYPQSLTSITLIGILTLMAFFLLVFTLVKFNQHLVLFGLFIFVVNIILVLQIVPFGDAIVADRYMYLPIIGLVLAVIYIAERFQFPKIVTVAVALVFCGISFVRSGLWKDSLPLFLNVIKTNPTSFIAINSLGVEYMERNDFDKSYRYLNQIVKLYPNYYKGYYNRGLLNGKTKRHKQAIFDFSKAIEYKNYYKAYAGRATVYYELKDFPKAIADAEKTIQLEENNIKANYVLANCYDDLNDLPKAVMYYNKSILLNSENPLYYLRRAIVYGKMQQFNLCLQDLDRCLRINPNYAEAYYWRGVAKVNMRQNPCSDLKRAVNLGFLDAQQPLINYCK